MWMRPEHPLITEDAKEWAKAGIKADLPSGADGTVRKDPFKVKDENDASSSDSDADADDKKSSGKSSSASKMAKSAAARFSPMAFDPKRPWKSRCRRDARRTVVLGDEDGRIKVLDLSWMLKIVKCSPVSSAKDVIGIRRSSIVALTAGKDLKDLVAAQLADQGITRPTADLQVDTSAPESSPAAASRTGGTTKPHGSTTANKGSAHSRLAGRRRRSMQLQDGSLADSMGNGDDGANSSTFGASAVGFADGSVASSVVPTRFADDDDDDALDAGDGDYMTAGARAALSEGVR